MGTHLHQESINPSSNNIAMKTMRAHQRGGTSESSTTSDNTTDFIDIVKKHDVVYNTHHPDYKNVEVKLKVWTQIAKEIGLSVDASKRKWKNLRDSYTKYLRSFRAGSKTSRKYQFWAHAEHMEFLKPFQGPGRSNNGVIVTKDDEETECDLGYQVLAKATTNSTDDDGIIMKPSNVGNNATSLSLATSLANVLPNFVAASGLSTSTMGLSSLPPTGSSAGNLVLPVPSLPTVQLPPSLTAKPIMGPLSNPTSSTPTSLSVSMSLTTPSSLSSSLASLTSSSVASQVFNLPSLSAKGPIPMPASNTASSVGCLIIEPQLFASADTFKKEFNNTSLAPSMSSSSTTCTTQITPSNLHMYPNISAQVATAAAAAAASAANSTNRLNPPLITKIRRVQPSPQQQQTSSAINLSFSGSTSSAAAPLTAASTSSSSMSYNTPNGFSSTGPPFYNSFLPSFASNIIPSTITAASSSNGPSPAKRLKNAEAEISAILQANRELDANTLFFLSLARSVRTMPTKFQSLAKMRCMRIVSDIELDLDNLNSDIADQSGNHAKYCTTSTDSPPLAVGGGHSSHINDTAPHSEHFVYVMSPSRVEGMIDLSSDDENTQNGIAASTVGGGNSAAIGGNLNGATGLTGAAN